MSTDGLSDEDRRLWSQVAENIAPLKATEARLRRNAKPAPKPEAKTQAKIKAKKPAKPAPAQARFMPRPSPPPPANPTAPAARGRVDGLDRRTAERFRRGKIPIEARLDLHGMTQAEARLKLEGFIRHCRGQGKRCVLVITGKGGARTLATSAATSAPTPFADASPAGVLRRRTPEWLGAPELASLVLSLAPALPGDGGAGALYVLLKRKRGG